MSSTLRDYYSAADTEIGEMIEGRLCWNEFCPSCARKYMNVYPYRQHRSIDIFEVCNAYRNYRCYACHNLLWDRHRVSDNEPPKDPMRPRTGSTVVSFPKKEDA